MPETFTAEDFSQPQTFTAADFGGAPAAAAPLTFSAADFSAPVQTPGPAKPIAPPPGFQSWEQYDRAGHEFTAGQTSSDFLQAVATHPLGFLKALPTAASQIAETLGAHVLNTLRAVNNGGMPWNQPVLKVTRDDQGREHWSEGSPEPVQPGVPLWRPQGNVMEPDGNKLEQIVSGLTTPGMLATLPFSEAKPVQAYFLSQTAPGAVQAAVDLFKPGGTPDERHAAATDLLLNSIFSFGLARGLSRPRAPETPPSSGQPDLGNAGPGPNGNATFPPPTPESAETLQAQVAATHDPNTPKAVTLVTPGETAPLDHGLQEVQTAQGLALVNPLKIHPDDAKAQFDAGGGGQLLGLSTDRKPANDDLSPQTPVLETRNADGTVVATEVVTP